MKPPRGLSAADAALWKRVTASVIPLTGKKPSAVELEKPPLPSGEGLGVGERAASTRPRPQRRAPPPNPSLRGGELDSTWERKLTRATIRPDFTLDLHGYTLDQAHRRLDAGLAQAKALGARVVLLIAGKPRPADPADRGHKRGAIRAKVLDWLDAGPHAGDIAAIRQAHRRHGGDGALYLVLKRPR